MLLIDDDESSRYLMTRSLLAVAPDLEVVEAESADEGLLRLADSQPDLVLLDLNMPGIDGVQVLHRVRGDDRRANCPVVVLSASDDERQVAKAYGHHANAYVLKPDSMEDYWHLARSLCDFWLREALTA